MHGTINKLALATVLSALFAVPVRAEIELKAVSSLPVNIPEARMFVDDFVKSVNDRGKGSVQIKFLGGPEVNPPATAVAGLARGLFDIVYGPASYYAGSVPELLSLVGSNQPIEILRDNGAIDLLSDIWAKKSGVRILAWQGSSTQMHLYLTRKPEIMADGPSLKGLKIRSSPTYRGLLAALEGTPVDMKASDIFSGLERGVIQGLGWPSTGVPALGVARIVKYRIDPGFYRVNIVIAANAAKLKALPNAAREIVLSAALAHEKSTVAAISQTATKELTQLKSHGLQVVELPDTAAKRYLGTAYDIIWERIGKSAPEHASALKAKFYKAE